MTKNKFTFEEIFEQNERRIHYHLHKLNIRDPHQEFYQEGLVAMWTAHKNYQPDKGALSSYFNFMIRRRLIDLIRKESRRLEREEFALTGEQAAFETKTYHNASHAALTVAEHYNDHAELWQQVRELLTEKQWKWVRYYIIEGKTLKEIAEQEEVSIEAVKSWAKEAKKKLRNTDFEKLMIESVY